MELQIGIGFSDHQYALKAAEQASDQALETLGSDRISLALLFVTPHYAPGELTRWLQNKLDHPTLCGTTCPDIIHNTAMFHRGIMIVLLSSEALKCSSAHIPHLDLQDTRLAGKKILQKCCQGFGKHNLNLFLSFFDSSLTHISNLKQGLSEEIGGSFPVIGAGGGPAVPGQKSYQYCDNAFFTKGAAGMAFGGGVISYSSCHHGWSPLGKPRTVTQSVKNIIHAIDERPAADLYENFFDFDPAKISAYNFDMLTHRYPLGIFCGHKKDFLLKKTLAVKKDGTIVCQEHIPEGAEIHIMLANKESCLQAAERAAKDIKKQAGNRNIQCLLILQSVMQRYILSRNWRQSIERIIDVLGHDFPIVGMTTDGELYDSPAHERLDRMYRLNGNLLLLGLT
ncbi:MAG: FIST signal transduction protein [Candidatus Omnitrophota bacterium]